MFYDLFLASWIVSRYLNYMLILLDLIVSHPYLPPFSVLHCAWQWADRVSATSSQSRSESVFLLCGGGEAWQNAKLGVCMLV